MTAKTLLSSIDCVYRERRKKSAGDGKKLFLCGNCCIATRIFLLIANANKQTNLKHFVFALFFCSSVDFLDDQTTKNRRIKVKRQSTKYSRTVARRDSVRCAVWQSDFHCGNCRFFFFFRSPIEISATRKGKKSFRQNWNVGKRRDNGKVMNWKLADTFFSRLSFTLTSSSLIHYNWIDEESILLLWHLFAFRCNRFISHCSHRRHRRQSGWNKKIVKSEQNIKWQLLFVLIVRSFDSLSHRSHTFHFMPSARDQINSLERWE